MLALLLRLDTSPSYFARVPVVFKTKTESAVFTL